MVFKLFDEVDIRYIRPGFWSGVQCGGALPESRREPTALCQRSGEALGTTCGFAQKHTPGTAWRVWAVHDKRCQVPTKNLCFLRSQISNTKGKEGIFR
jgi:hypothetical protein